MHRLIQHLATPRGVALKEPGGCQAPDAKAEAHRPKLHEKAAACIPPMILLPLGSGCECGGRGRGRQKRMLILAPDCVP